MIRKSHSHQSCQKNVQLTILWNKVFKSITFPSFRKHSYWPQVFLCLGFTEGTAALPAQSWPSGITVFLLFHLPCLFLECILFRTVSYMCAECPARFIFCLNTGLRAANNAEAARGAELLQGSDEPRAATSPWHLSTSHRITEPWIQLSLLKKLLIIIML